MHETLLLFDAIIIIIIIVSQNSKSWKERATVIVMVVSFFSKGGFDQRINRYQRRAAWHASLPLLLSLPVSPEQILATFILARPADCDTGWILIVNAAVYQSRIDSRPLSPESPGVIHDEIRIESFFAVIDIHANGAKGYHTPYLENFFLSLSVSLSPIFMRVTCYAWKEGRRRGSDFSNTFPPGSETIRHGIFDATFSSTSPSSSSDCKFYSCFREE